MSDKSISSMHSGHTLLSSSLSLLMIDATTSWTPLLLSQFCPNNLRIQKEPDPKLRSNKEELELLERRKKAASRVCCLMVEREGAIYSLFMFECFNVACACIHGRFSGLFPPIQ